MIRLKNVSVRFGSVPVLENVSLHIGPGEFVCLVGKTGSGKTTLLRLLYFDLLPGSGEAIVDETSSLQIRKRDIPIVRRRLGIVFQDFKLLEERSVYDNVAFALLVTGTPSGEIGKKVLRVLADVGLSHKRSSMPGELSGGEQQRVVIARALVNKPVILLADEPTGNLDSRTGETILDLIREIHRQEAPTIVMATHSDHAASFASSTIRVTDGKVEREARNR